MKLTFNQFVFLKVRPKMLCRPMAGSSFVLVPLEDVEKRHIPSWQYALVNKDQKMHQMVFRSEDELIDALFKANEIWWGCNEKWPNPLFNKEAEMHIAYDLANNEA